MTVLDSPQGRQSNQALNPLEWRRRWLTMDANPAAVAFARTLHGQAILHGILLACLAAMPFVRPSHVVLVAVALALCWAFPARRLAVVAATGVTYFLLRPFKSEEVYAAYRSLTGTTGQLLLSEAALFASGLVFLGFAAFMLYNIRACRLHFASERPLLFMFALMVALTAVSTLLPVDHLLHAPAWIGLAYLASSFFFLGYVLIDARSKAPPPFAVQMGFLRPFWAGVATPVKGPSFFTRHEARDEDALAVSRLKAVKLAVWALILALVWHWGFNLGIHGAIGFPKLDDLILATAAGEPSLLATRWLAVAVDFMAVVLYMAAAVHSTVAGIRMAGFAIPRGMVRPFESRSIAEFWGRYLFYFKEMLVDFFFFPAFRRYFRDHPRLRIAFATFCAAFIGNILFDLIHVLPLVPIEGVSAIAERYVSYTIYAGLLTIGVIWSQMAAKPKPEDGWLRYDVLPRIQVVGFFALLQVIDDSFGDAPVGARLNYYLSLIGIAP